MICGSCGTGRPTLVRARGVDVVMRCIHPDATTQVVGTTIDCNRRFIPLAIMTRIDSTRLDSTQPGTCVALRYSGQTRQPRASSEILIVLVRPSSTLPVILIWYFIKRGSRDVLFYSLDCSLDCALLRCSCSKMNGKACTSMSQSQGGWRAMVDWQVSTGLGWSGLGWSNLGTQSQSPKYGTGCVQ
jgi:hypothetical protein